MTLLREQIVDGAVIAPPRAADNLSAASKRQHRTQWWLDPSLRHRLVPSVAFGLCASVVTTGVLSLSLNSLDFLRLPLMMLMTASLVALAVFARSQIGTVERGYLVLVALSLASTVFLGLWPEWLYGHEINGLVHRSLLTAFIMIAIGLPGMCNALFWVLGGAPTDWDTSRYPLLLFPVILALALYGVMVLKVVTEGFDGLGWDVVSRGVARVSTTEGFTYQPGLRNYIAGTMLLIVLTSAIALPIGVGAGVCMSEYDGWISTVVGFSTLMLRAISVFILGVIAFGLADWAEAYDVGTWQSDWFRGYYIDPVGGFRIPAHGSFITASLVLSLLVIPVIARSTVEGLRSIPREVREGSIALGATEGHGFLFLLIPWAIPNVLTGLILGCAEAAGSVAVILFIAGTGENGVGPFREATSLGFLVYYADKGPKPFPEAMGEYQYTGALLLLFITFGLSITALFLKQKFGARYRGVSNQ
jgi:ABC-type phosphate transport system permease subunit